MVTQIGACTGSFELCDTGPNISQLNCSRQMDHAPWKEHSQHLRHNILLPGVQSVVICLTTADQPADQDSMPKHGQHSQLTHTEPCPKHMTQAQARHAEREAHLCNKLFAAYRAYPLQASEGARQVSLELVEILATLRFSIEPHAFNTPCSSRHQRVFAISSIPTAWSCHIVHWYADSVLAKRPQAATCGMAVASRALHSILQHNILQQSTVQHGTAQHEESQHSQNSRAKRQSWDSVVRCSTHPGNGFSLSQAMQQCLSSAS